MRALVRPGILLLRLTLAAQENGPSEALGGRRDYLSFWAAIIQFGHTCA